MGNARRVCRVGLGLGLILAGCDGGAPDRGMDGQAPQGDSPQAGGKADDDSLQVADWENWTQGQVDRMDRMIDAFAKTLPREEYGASADPMVVTKRRDMSNVNQYPELDGFVWIDAEVMLEDPTTGDRYRLLFIKDEGEDGVGLRMLFGELIKFEGDEVDGADPPLMAHTLRDLASAVHVANHHYTPDPPTWTWKESHDDWATGYIGTLRYDTVRKLELRFPGEFEVYVGWFDMKLERLILFEQTQPWPADE